MRAVHDEVLRVIRDLKDSPMGDGSYSRGYRDALTYIEEVIQEAMWERGLDEETR